MEPEKPGVTGYVTINKLFNLLSLIFLVYKVVVYFRIIIIHEIMYVKYKCFKILLI